MKKSKQARRREFSQKDRETIINRDRHECIFCRMKYHMEDVDGYGQQLPSIMHYIGRAQGGLGIPENGALGCQCHHEMYDNGNKGRHGEMRGLFREYLMQYYPDWNEEKLVYSKWRELCF
jgi:hypothetical protein